MNVLKKGCPWWIVWRLEGPPPTHAHETEQLARKEAQRLASVTPGVTFHVYRIVATVARNDLTITDYANDELPF